MLNTSFNSMTMAKYKEVTWY